MRNYRIEVKGIVQGVGFRPFIYNLALSKSINGYVVNTSEGVTIFVKCGDVESFASSISSEAPVMADVHSVEIFDAADEEFEDFQIRESEIREGVTLVPVDMAVCDDCLSDMNDESNRRYRYPFTNCTNCGPRYSIIKNMPYDRPKTTMKIFKMCPDCGLEYEDVADRRFHAQPNACPTCGPEVYLDNFSGDDAVREACRLIDKGEIIAVKGLGGYHIVCDACNDLPIKVLRGLKNRAEKPLAIMTSIENFKSFGVSEDELRLFDSPQAPIVVVKVPKGVVSRFANPISDRIGFMKPYTPLHKLLVEGCESGFIIATSGNKKDEPIAKDEVTAQETLKDFTKYFLHHNRQIHTRVDDSLATVVNGRDYVMRRGRGFAPYPVILPEPVEGCVLALGAHLKNTITIAKGRYAFVSQYIGDLDNPETSAFFEETIMKTAMLYGLKPDRVVCDDHPDYFSSKYAKRTGLPVTTVQHHVAHMLGCMAENGLKDNVIGVVLDGTGLGTDGSIWGGEFFVMKDGLISRVEHFPKVMQPGMDSAAKNPARMLVSYLHQFGLLDRFSELLTKRLDLTLKDINLITSMIDKEINCIETTSAGRLFESLGAIVTGVSKNAFEAHSAMKLEGLIVNDSLADVDIDTGAMFFYELFERTLTMIEKEMKPSDISQFIHSAINLKIIKTIEKLVKKHDINDVVLSGGVFQNTSLLKLLLDFSAEKMFYNICIHKTVPTNDSSISLGQAFYLASEYRLKFDF